jgi:hypothetical protein
VLSLDWDRRRRVTPAGTKSQETWPEAESGCQSPGESRCGAPEGERAPTLARFRARAHASGNTCLRCADIGWMRLSALRSPRLFSAGCEGLSSCRSKLGRAGVARTMRAAANSPRLIAPPCPTRIFPMRNRARCLRAFAGNDWRRHGARSRQVRAMVVCHRVVERSP